MGDLTMRWFIVFVLLLLLQCSIMQPNCQEKSTEPDGGPCWVTWVTRLCLPPRGLLPGRRNRRTKSFGAMVDLISLRFVWHDEVRQTGGISHSLVDFWLSNSIQIRIDLINSAFCLAISGTTGPVRCVQHDFFDQSRTVSEPPRAKIVILF